MDSIPLEWDHDYDLSRDLESAVSRTLPSEDEEGQEEKDFYLRGAVGLSGREEPLLYAGLKENKKEGVLEFLLWLSGLRIQHCCKLQHRSQVQPRSSIAVAIAWACGSDSTPSAGISICRRCSHKKKKKKECILYWKSIC